jgi:hypothetical protein
LLRLQSQSWVIELNANDMEQRRKRGRNAFLLLSDTEMRRIVEAGGGRYVGIMSEIPGKAEPIVLFISPQTKSTLSLPCSRLTAEAVREQLAESDAAFSHTSSKCVSIRRET